jgi:cholesterol oxidase
VEATEADLSHKQESALAAKTTEAWLLTLRERAEEVEEDTEEAFEKRRALAKLLVKRIDVGRDEDSGAGRVRVRITYRFGPPTSPEPTDDRPGEEDGFVAGERNSLDYTYLSAAQRLGAELRTRCEVGSFEPRDGGGYNVRYVYHDPEREGSRTDTSSLPLETLTTERLVLAAGSLGSTFLFFKNRSAFPRISPRLGTRFGGNGDLLTFAIKSSEESSGARVPRIIDPGYGPVITSGIRVGEELDGEEGRGFYLEDAGFPEHLTWILQVFDTPGALWRWRMTATNLVRNWLGKDPESDLGAEISELLGQTDLSAGLLPMIGMGRDIPDGNMTLRGTKLDIDWRKLKSGPFFARKPSWSR